MDRNISSIPDQGNHIQSLLASTANITVIMSAKYNIKADLYSTLYLGLSI